MSSPKLDMTMRIAIHGYGKMGKTIEKVARESGHDVVAIFDSDRKAEMNGADVVIDFTNHEASLNYLKIASDKNRSIVIGSTGFTSEEMKIVSRLAENFTIHFEAGVRAHDGE